MRNVSGYLTDDGRFFQDKKEAEAHERMNAMNKYIEDFCNINSLDVKFEETLRDWENYKKEKMK
jgi:uncharacterized protein YutD